MFCLEWHMGVHDWQLISQALSQVRDMESSMSEGFKFGADE